LIIKKLFLLIFSLLFAFIIASCTKNSSQNLIYAVSGEFKPFSFVDDHGNLDGFDVALGKILAHELSKKPSCIKYKFAGIIEGLKSNRFDLAIAGHTITPERKKHVNFSIPYYYSGPQVFSRQKLENIDLNDKELAVSKGSTYFDIAQKYTTQIKVYDSDHTALQALARGRHHAVITDKIVGQLAINSGLNIFSNQSLGVSEQGIAVSKENTALLKKVNDVLSKLKKNGKLKELSIKYLSVDVSKKN